MLCLNMFLKHSCEIYVLLILIMYINIFDRVLRILHLNIIRTSIMISIVTSGSKTLLKLRALL